MNSLVSPLYSTWMIGLVALSMILNGQSVFTGRRQLPGSVKVAQGTARGRLTLHVGLDLGVTKLATDETLGVKDGAG